jgi:hypothetical protein
VIVHGIPRDNVVIRLAVHDLSQRTPVDQMAATER